MDQKVADLITLVRRRYPDWDGFDHPPFTADEIAYKQSTIAKASDLINEAELRRLIAEEQYEEFINRLDKLAQDSNLLWRRVPMASDANILYQSDLDEPLFCSAMLYLLYGDLPTPERIERFTNYTLSADLPNKWPFVTYFLFICHPDRELFVKPQAAKWFLTYMGRPPAYSQRPSAPAYAALLESAAELRAALQPYHPHDMVDLQSFIWVAFRESGELASGLDIKAQIELEQPAYEISPTPVLIKDSMREVTEIVATGKSQVGETHYWKIAPGESARFWNDWRDEGFVAIGWSELGSIANLKRTDFEKLRDEACAKYGWNKTAVNQVWEFSHIQIGDQVIANKGMSKVLGIGTVTGSYYFEPGVEYGHRLPVDWYDLTERDVNEANWYKALMQLTPNRFEFIRNTLPSNLKKLSLTQLVEETGLEENELTTWMQAIERKGQAILYGPPGTGKTYLAEKLAQYLVSGSDGFYDLVQFHPAYSYEEFIQGIRPQTHPNGSLTYPVLPGRFLEFCHAARLRTGRCVLIIDEINRANLSRVFGELMYLLEYRNRDIPLAGGGRLAIPANVYLIGTMNTADRSIALVDYALRRRFAFLPLLPNYDLLRRFHQQTGFDPTGLIKLLTRLNNQIGDPHYAIGITFFLYPNLPAHLENIWRTEIEPYLEEYFYDRPEQVNAFRWPAIHADLL